MKVMKLSIITIACLHLLTTVADAQLVKMCLEEIFPSGHARSDPIINQNCASGHVHTFYGPQNFHPNTTYEDIRDTSARFSSSPWVENQSLYWHPTVYEVYENEDWTKTFVRAKTRATAYYRWFNGVDPPVEAFPPGFRMIAHSNDEGAEVGEIGGRYNLLVECCRDGTQDCETFGELTFPTMPTCWDGESVGDDNDHKSHMRYTTDGKVNGPCPEGFDRRLPQIELNINIGLGDYDATTKSYELSDGADIYHVDFFNGWQEGKLQEIIDECEGPDSDDSRNPPCSCTPNFDEDSDFLSANEELTGFVCDADVRRLIIDEATDITSSPPLVSCEGPNLIPRFWDQITEGLFSTCDPLDDLDFDEDEEDGDFDNDGEEDGDFDSDGDGDGDGDGEEDGEVDCFDECCFDDIDDCFNVVGSICSREGDEISDCEDKLRPICSPCLEERLLRRGV